MVKRAAWPLDLVLEQKLYELLPNCRPSSRLEASGIEAADGHFLIVLDNLRTIARIPFHRRPLALEAGDFVGHLETTGYEDLAYDRDERRLFLLREAVPSRGAFSSDIVEWNDRFEPVRNARLDFAFRDANKGFEGLACTYRHGHRWLLAMCEGNRCQCGRKGRTPGGGRIQVFAQGHQKWERRHELALPEDVPFEDYSGLALDGDRVGVISQASSMLWVGRLHPDAWRWIGAGDLYEFPRSKRGKKIYDTVEGLVWLGPRELAVVSDRRKKRQGPQAGKKDQSIHIFALPVPS